ncbi:MAG: restriction endonuclease [Anaerolineales bacterium]|nr:restriction endonuclease [Anaerolineales bacterium]
MKIGDIFRYARPHYPELEYRDGIPNYFYATSIPGLKLPLLEHGINPIQKIKAPEGLRRPTILISSSPHKIGSLETPWQDTFDPDNGHIRYFGDNKNPGRDPSLTPGNKILLEAFSVHNSPSENIRKNAVPLIFFRRVNMEGKAKGFVQFQGYGIIQRVGLITQFDHKRERAFTNYVFDLVVFGLATENEDFDWKWINMRRDPEVSLDASVQIAPKTWKEWINHGSKAVERYRRRVSKLMTASAEEQRPPKSSREQKILVEIYDFYKGRKTRFEGLAAFIAEKVVGETGGSYRSGWVTPPSSDGGSDFIGRLDIATGFAKTSIIVLTQAKCEKLGTPTGGNHIARTVARLKRGWIGVYVTTSYFSESVQREVIEDKYPIVLIHGKRVAQEVLKMIFEEEYSSIQHFLESIDNQYDTMIQIRQPEEILFD